MKPPLRESTEDYRCPCGRDLKIQPSFFADRYACPVCGPVESNEIVRPGGQHPFKPHTHHLAIGTMQHLKRQQHAEGIELANRAGPTFGEPYDPARYPDE